MQNKNVLNYTLLRPLGKGGMAEVWYAENEIGNIAAVKILNEDLSHNAQIVERFRNEAKITVKLKHPNIRQVYDFATIDGRPCMVMEYLEGDDLHSRMKHGERFTDERIKKWWNQLASALNYTHAQGIVHRDIKPSNVFIDGEDNVKLLDFGIAKVQEGITMTQTGATMGTLMYMSPEQVLDSKHIDAKTDCYSLAVSFVHLLTGNAPYDTNTTNDYSIRKGIVEVPLDLTGVPTEWQSFLQPYLAKNPAERPALTEFSAETSHSGFVPPIPPSAPASEETFVGSQTVAAAKAAEEGTMIEGTAPTVKPSRETVVQGKAKKQAPAKPKKKRKGLIIGIIVAAVLLVGGGIGVVAWLSNRNVPVAQTMEFVDLGLPSGTLWKGMNEDGDELYSYGEAMSKYGDQLPTQEQWEELETSCTWTWVDGGYNVKGPNGNAIFLPAVGYQSFGDGGVDCAGTNGRYWSSTPCDSEYSWCMDFYSGGHYIDFYYHGDGLSVRLVQGE